MNIALEWQPFFPPLTGDKTSVERFGNFINTHKSDTKKSKTTKESSNSISVIMFPSRQHDIQLVFQLSCYVALITSF